MDENMSDVINPGNNEAVNMDEKSFADGEKFTPSFPVRHPDQYLGSISINEDDVNSNWSFFSSRNVDDVGNTNNIETFNAPSSETTPLRCMCCSPSSSIKESELKHNFIGSSSNISLSRHSDSSHTVGRCGNSISSGQIDAPQTFSGHMQNSHQSTMCMGNVYSDQLTNSLDMAECTSFCTDGSCVHDEDLTLPKYAHTHDSSNCSVSHPTAILDSNCGKSTSCNSTASISAESSGNLIDRSSVMSRCSSSVNCGLNVSSNISSNFVLSSNTSDTSCDLGAKPKKFATQHSSDESAIEQCCSSYEKNKATPSQNELKDSMELCSRDGAENFETPLSNPKTKRSLKSKLVVKFSRNKNQKDDSNKMKRKSFGSWLSCLSRTNKFAHSSNSSSLPKLNNAAIDVCKEAVINKIDINTATETVLPNEELENEEASISSDMQQNDVSVHHSTSSSSDDDFMNNLNFEPDFPVNSTVGIPSSGNVPLPFNYNSVLELHLLFERSLRLSIMGDGIDAPVFNRRTPDTFANQVVHTQVDYVHCLVPDLLAVTNCSFYWGKMDRYEAEALLENRPEGTFLLRDSAQDEYLFSVSFRRYGKSLHARIEQLNHKFSFDSLDVGVFASDSVCGLIEHYKDPSCCMFFEPMLTNPLPRTFPFPLQHLCRAAICSSTSYDGINQLHLPKVLSNYLKEYHYKHKVRVRLLDN